jgi:alkylation response protein AidB-like acyl-CoA dehydrogenase
MNFDLTDDQRMLVDTVTSFVKKQSPVTRLRGLREDPIGWQPAVWRQMGEFGWLGVMFPESVGGAGGSFLDAALILEQFGTTLVPEPLMPALVAGSAILGAGSAEQHKRWLEPLVEGRTVLTLAHSEAGGRFAGDRVTTRARRSGGSFTLDGHKRWVLAGHAADAYVVSARSEAGVSLFMVPKGARGLETVSVKTMDGAHGAMLNLSGVEVGADALLGAEGGGLPALEQALDVGAAATCAEGYGIMRTALWMTVEYLRTREQFGVKIGTFQALQHRAVDMFVETELGKSMMILAALRVTEAGVSEAERKSAVSSAKVQLAQSGRLVTQQAIQLHGGIGVTDEHDIGLYFKRMHVLATLFGDEEYHLTRFATLPTFTEGVRA